jgi:transposase-like protein
VALASGAYALGSQAGDGDAAAAKTPNGAQPYGPPGHPGFGRFHGGPRPDLSGLADRLGVSEAKLRAALEDLRSAQRPGPGKAHDDLAQELADALGIDASKVTAALDKLRPRAERRQHRADRRCGHGPADRRRGPAVAALAKELGVTQAQLRAAFDKLRAAKEKEFADRRAEFAKQLAAKLGIDVSKVEKALPAQRPFRGRPGP